MSDALESIETQQPTTGPLAAAPVDRQVVAILIGLGFLGLCPLCSNAAAVALSEETQMPDRPVTNDAVTAAAPEESQAPDASFAEESQAPDASFAEESQAPDSYVAEESQAPDAAVPGVIDVAVLKAKISEMTEFVARFNKDDVWILDEEVARLLRCAASETVNAWSRTRLRLAAALSEDSDCSCNGKSKRRKTTRGERMVAGIVAAAAVAAQSTGTEKTQPVATSSTAVANTSSQANAVDVASDCSVDGHVEVSYDFSMTSMDLFVVCRDPFGTEVIVLD